VDLKQPDQKQSQEPKKESRWGFRGMSARDWLQLLIVPFALTVLGFVFSMQQDARQQRLETQRTASDQKIAEQRAQDDALQAYLDQMSTLVLEKNLHNPHQDSVFKIAAGYEVNKAEILARARTVTVLRRLGPKHKAQVLQFLVEAALVQNLPDRGRPVIRLVGADLQKAPLGSYDLHVINLDGANLSKANLSNADLSGADLSYASGITNEELEQQAKSLEGAIMPNGQKYEG
jgi:hypothetical protein